MLSFYWLGCAREGGPIAIGSHLESPPVRYSTLLFTQMHRILPLLQLGLFSSHTSLSAETILNYNGEQQSGSCGFTTQLSLAVECDQLHNSICRSFLQIFCCGSSWELISLGKLVLKGRMWTTQHSSGVDVFFVFPSLFLYYKSTKQIHFTCFIITGKLLFVFFQTTNVSDCLKNKHNLSLKKKYIYIYICMYA